MTRECPPELVAILRLLGEANAFCDALGDEMPKMLMRLVPQRPTLTQPQRTVHSLVERAAVWMQTMSRLDRWTDYQAQSCGCRAMLELAVDVALVTSEPQLAARMWAFEESAKLKSCNRYRAFALRTKMANPNQTKMVFGARNENAVKALRQKHWGTADHPTTWFGKPFEQMAEEADRRLGSDYASTYATRYDELCWGAHGSTLAIVRPAGLPPEVIPSFACAVVGESSRLALDLTKRAATFLGLDGEAVCDELSAKMQAARERYQLQPS
jgi:hypothetical protein